MNEFEDQPRTLYLLACASPAARLVPDVVQRAQSAGWQVCVITTPHGVRFLDIPLVERLTGYPVRSEYKHPDAPDILPRAQALLVFPATFNTINKWALGISDTLVVGLLCEYTGLHIPIVAAPVTGEGLDKHPALQRSLKMLRRYGVSVLSPPGIFLHHHDPVGMLLEALHQITRKDELP